MIPETLDLELLRAFVLSLPWQRCPICGAPNFEVYLDPDLEGTCFSCAQEFEVEDLPYEGKRMLYGQRMGPPL